MEQHLSKAEAETFFSILYGGPHHVPSGKIYDHGFGFCVKHNGGAMATFDSNSLTRFVLLCHKHCYRGEISGNGMMGLTIAIWKRQPTGRMHDRHPTIEQAIEALS